MWKKKGPFFYPHRRKQEEEEKWNQKQQHRHIKVLQDSQTLNVTLNTLPLSNAWKSLARTKVNVKSILMSTRNARKRREKHDWNATRVAPSFHESCRGCTTSPNRGE